MAYETPVNGLYEAQRPQGAVTECLNAAALLVQGCFFVPTSRSKSPFIDLLLWPARATSARTGWSRQRVCRARSAEFIPQRAENTLQSESPYQPRKPGESSFW